MYIPNYMPGIYLFSFFVNRYVLPFSVVYAELFEGVYTNEIQEVYTANFFKVYIPTNTQGVYIAIFCEEEYILHF